MYQTVRLFAILIAVFMMTGCSSAFSGFDSGNAATHSPTAGNLDLAPSQSSASNGVIKPTEETVVTTSPDGDPRVQSQRELLLARLDLGGAGAQLQATETRIPAIEVGAIEVWAFELPDPYVYLSFYLFDDAQLLEKARHRWVEEGEARSRLPEGVEFSGGAFHAMMDISYYYSDGSRGDTQAAEVALYEILGRVGGDE